MKQNTVHDLEKLVQKYPKIRPSLKVTGFFFRDGKGRHSTDDTTPTRFELEVRLGKDVVTLDLHDLVRGVVWGQDTKPDWSENG